MHRDHLAYSASVPRQRGDSKWYLITPMVNGLVRAECHRPDCHWWSDHVDEDDAKAAMKDHRKGHRAPTKKSDARNKAQQVQITLINEEESWHSV
jgi:hypothetical protein